LTSLLAEFDYRIIRIFVLFDASMKGDEERTLRAEIFRRIAEDMKDAGWTYPYPVSGTEDTGPFGDDDEEGEGDDNAAGDTEASLGTSPTAAAEEGPEEAARV
jgi:hypothetical protein